jgi:transmembrane sensor
MPDAGNEIDQEASEWTVRVAAGTLSQADSLYLEQWMNADARHRGAFVRAQAGMRALETALQRAPVIAHAATSVPVSVLAAPPLPGALQKGRVHDERSRIGFSTRRGILVGVGALAASAIGGIALLPLLRAARYGSGIGEVRRVALEDGSVATIGSRSVVTAAMSSADRRVVIKEGEAWFDVKPNAARPFIVSARDVQVRAVGTAFGVSDLGDGIDVIVSEGVVDVWRARDGRRIRLQAGERLRFGRDGTSAANAAPLPETLDAATVARLLSWREGLIVLAAEPLGEAAARFSRYGSTRIVIADPTLARVKLTGRFKSNEAPAFARAAATVTGATISQEGDTITLSK